MLIVKQYTFSLIEKGKFCATQAGETQKLDGWDIA
jgi:hypothetical protein